MMPPGSEGSLSLWTNCPPNEHPVHPVMVIMLHGLHSTSGSRSLLWQHERIYLQSHLFILYSNMTGPCFAEIGHVPLSLSQSPQRAMLFHSQTEQPSARGVSMMSSALARIDGRGTPNVPPFGFRP